MNNTNIPEIAKALEEVGYNNILFISLETAEEVLNEERMDILHKIEEENIRSIADLARRLDRQNRAVHRDLIALAKQGMVDFKKDGRSKIPVLRHDAIFVKPIMLSNESTGEE